jgi:hypothetical protein
LKQNKKLQDRRAAEILLQQQKQQAQELLLKRQETGGRQKAEKETKTPTGSVSLCVPDHALHQRWSNKMNTAFFSVSSSPASSDMAEPVNGRYVSAPAKLAGISASVVTLLLHHHGRCHRHRLDQQYCSISAVHRSTFSPMAFPR